MLVETDPTVPQRRCQSSLKSKHSFMSINNGCLYFTNIFTYILCKVTHHGTHPTPDSADGEAAGSHQGSRLTNPPRFLCREGAGVEPGPRHSLGLGAEMRPRSGGTAVATHAKGDDVHFWSQGACM